MTAIATTTEDPMGSTLRDDKWGHNQTADR